MLGGPTKDPGCVVGQLSARDLLEVPRDTLEREDVRWKTVTQLRQLLPTEEISGKTYLQGGLLGESEGRSTYADDEEAPVVETDAGFCAVM